MTQNEIKIAQKLINKISSGTQLCLKDIYGKNWMKISKPKEFGKKFKHAVKNKKLNNIIHLGIRNSGRCDEYEIT